MKTNFNNLISRNLIVFKNQLGGLLLRIFNLLPGNKTQHLDYDELRTRQAYAESGFNNNLQSPMGARGMFQITPAVLQDYNKANKTNFKVSDLNNQLVNALIRDWLMDRLQNKSWVTKGGANDSILYAKALAGYNWGSGNVVDALNKAKADGVDIYNSWDWLKVLPQETRDYVNFVLRNLDNSSHRNNATYLKYKNLKAKEVNLLNKKSDGGKLNYMEYFN